MRTTILLLSILLTATLAKAQDITGTWSGTLEIQGTRLPLSFNISKAAEGLSATMDSPDQGIYDIPVTSVRFDDRVLELSVGSLGITYEGTLQASDTIEGTFTQGPNSFPLDLTKGERAKKTRPQEPSAPFPYTAEEVEITNPHDGTTLAGTLTFPKEGKDFPAVILLSGSGPQDRNSALFGHQPFLVLADHLSSNGIAVLRLDDRGIGGSGGELSTTSFATSVNDVEAAISFLESRKEIDDHQIGLLGHSEGGIIAPLVAEGSSAVEFLVLLAAPVLKGNELLLLQKKKIEEKIGISEMVIQQNQEVFRKAYELISTFEGEGQELKQDLAEYFRGELIGLPETQLNQIVEELTAPRMIDFIKSDPAACLRNIEIPTLALYGGKDVQVPANENIAQLKESIGAENENFRIHVLEDLNHLFQESSTGLPNEYGQLEQTFSPKALGLISEWIKEQTE